MSEEKKYLSKPDGWISAENLSTLLIRDAMGCLDMEEVLWHCVVTNLRDGGCFLTKAGCKFLKVECEHAGGDRRRDNNIPLDDLLSSSEPAKISVGLIVSLLEPMRFSGQLKALVEKYKKMSQDLWMTQTGIDEIFELVEKLPILESREKEYDTYIGYCVRKGILTIAKTGPPKTGAPGGPMG